MAKKVLGRRWSALAALAAITVVAGCGSGGGDVKAASDGLPKEIPVSAIADLTGFAASYGTQYKQGVEIALAQIESEGLLGGSKLKVTFADTTSDAKTAATHMAKAARSDSVAVLGPTLSNENLALAPVAQKAGIPYLAASSPLGLPDIGDHVYSITPPQSKQAPLLAKNVASEAKNAVVIFSNDNPAIVDLEEAFEPAAKAAGLTVKQVLPTTLTTTDFSALVTKAVGAQPDAIVILGGGPMMPALLKSLKGSGFTGKVFGNQGSDGTLASSGTEADGYRYVTEWAPSVDNPESKKFVEAYKAKFPDGLPYYMTIDGYNATMFLAKALKEAGSVDRAKVLQGLQKVAAAGFASPSGNVNFVDPGHRQLTTPGIIVERHGNDLTVVQSGE